MRKVVLIVFLFSVIVVPLGGRALADPAAVDQHRFVQGEFLVKVKAPIGDPEPTLLTGFGSALPRAFEKVQISESRLIMSAPQSALAAMQIGDPAHVPNGLLHIKTTLDVEGTMKLIGELMSDPQVEWAEPNYIVAAFNSSEHVNDPLFSSRGSWGQSYEDMWALKMVRAPEAWSYSQGEGVVVAVIDTGVDYAHPDLAQNIWRNLGEIPGSGNDDDGNGFIDDVVGWDFSSCTKFGMFGCAARKERDNDPSDGQGHGTHVAGIIASVAGNGIGIAGVAPQALIMPVKALADDGAGTVADMVEAIKYAVDQGADIINLSWGAYESNAFSLRDAIAYAQNRGVICVAAAGNENVDVRRITPANIDNVIAVASVDENGRKSDFSNHSAVTYDLTETGIALAAPGGGSAKAESGQKHINILSLRGNGTDLFLGSKDYIPGSFIVDDRVSGAEYYRARGTSMSCPFVSGAAALVLSHLRSSPAWQRSDSLEARLALAAEVRARLLYTAAPFIDAPKSGGKEVSLGTGVVDAFSAVSAVRRPHLQIVDYGLREVWGNGDGISEQNEEIEIKLVFKNIWGSADSVEVDLLPGENLDIIHGTTVLGAVPAQQRGSTTNPLSFVYRGKVRYFTPVLLRFRVRSLFGEVKHEQFLNQRIFLGARRLTSSHVPVAEGYLGEFVPVSRPAVSGRKVVWSDLRNGGKDIYLYDADEGTERLLSHRSGNRIQPDPADQTNPSIDGSMVVWQDNRSGNWNIYLSDLNSSAAPAALPLPASFAGQDQMQPVVSGRSVAFTNRRSGAFGKLDVYYYDLDTGAVAQISDGVGFQFNPAISARRVVLEDPVHFDSFLIPDIRKGIDRLGLSPQGVWAIEPQIDGDRTVFTGVSLDTSVNIYMGVLGRDNRVTVQKLSDDKFLQNKPAIKGNLVVWQDKSSGDFNLVIKDLASGKTETVGTDFVDDRCPAVGEDMVSWVQGSALFAAFHPHKRRSVPNYRRVVMQISPRYLVRRKVLRLRVDASHEGFEQVWRDRSPCRFLISSAAAPTDGRPLAFIPLGSFSAKRSVQTVRFNGITALNGRQLDGFGNAAYLKGDLVCSGVVHGSSPAVAVPTATVGAASVKYRRWLRQAQRATAS